MWLWRWESLTFTMYSYHLSDLTIASRFAVHISFYQLHTNKNSLLEEWKEQKWYIQAWDESISSMGWLGGGQGAVIAKTATKITQQCDQCIHFIFSLTSLSLCSLPHFMHSKNWYLRGKLLSEGQTADKQHYCAKPPPLGTRYPSVTCRLVLDSQTDRGWVEQDAAGKTVPSRFCSVGLWSLALLVPIR